MFFFLMFVLGVVLGRFGGSFAGGAMTVRHLGAVRCMVLEFLTGIAGRVCGLLVAGCTLLAAHPVAD